MKLRIFISSVQSEFASERKALADYIRNDAIPLFAKHPDTFNPAWEIRCVQFYGTRVVKPIPSLHTYQGTVFELVDQAVDFVMSRVDFAVGAHDGENAAAPTRAEFPRDAIREAIVNAVCHRDYTSNACVQVMLFRDRLEIINPGSLPKGMTVEDLYGTHDSIPRNSLIARAMSWTSYVEKSGSGTGEILDKCVEYGLARPEFDPTAGFFKTVIWRASSGTGTSRRGQGLVGTQSRHPVAAPSRGTQSQHPVCHKGEKAIHVRVIALCEVPRSTKELLDKVGRSDRTKFKRFVLRTLMEDGILEWTIPGKPNSRLQKYRLTDKGRALAATLAKKHSLKPKAT